MIASFENFQARFIEEALDNIHDLEKALLELELSPGNKELLERVFRVMHSLKGSGAMFGFDKLSEFTHRMENIYDLVRSGKLNLSSNMLSVTLNSVDMLRILLEPEKLQQPAIQERYKNLVSDIDDVIRNETFQLLTSATLNTSISEPEKPVSHKMATWHIHFYPGPTAFENGTNILFLIDELGNMGNMYAIPGYISVPCLSELHPEQSYIYWDLFLATEEDQNAIKDVFIFVEDNSTIGIQKISDSDLFLNSDFSRKLEQLSSQQENIGLADFSDFIGSKLNIESDPSPQKAAIPCDDDKQNRSLSSIRVAADKIDGLVNLVSELVITQERLNNIASRYQIPELKIVTESVQKLTGMLRDSAFSISLIPVENMLTRFQRLVRDLSNDLGKKIAFTAKGTETELDKTMIESLTDPLLHIIRNCIDHGIELPDVRKLKGKPETGTIHLDAGYSGANVVLRIKDDGAGIQTEKVRQKAIAKGLISEADHLSDQELLNLVFLPGFSTAEKVTEVSGRGVGMDVVKRNIEAIRGEVAIHSEYGRGTEITITLPLVLSIIDGLLVKVNNGQYVIPMSLTDRIYSIESSQMENNFINVVTLDGVQYPFFNLRKELSIKGNTPKKCQMVVVNHEGQNIAIPVDQVIGKIQAVLKPLGRMYHEQKIISAATIMGDGTIALVLDTNAIIKELLNHS
ncbi:chemotaxis protein CheA [Alkaliflexus imshenetskii]|uniref:chemotaxis protein CheA n=1 Tax=Alkaliflexus imshenetskii TaxID=286730 RepID=UPI0004797880|nr:chemotaxis protein CheA [Alkaliflexus imshenetskii]